MKIMPLQKAFFDVVSEVRDFYSNNPVNIVDYYADDSVSFALNRLRPLRDIFESYARKNLVSVSIDRASILEGDSERIKPSLKFLLDKSIALCVTNNINGKSKTAIIDTTKDSFIHQGTESILLKNKNGKEFRVHSRYSHEDNFVRAVFRRLEYLTKQISK